MKLREINSTAAIIRTERCRIDPELLFGIEREKQIAPPKHRHQSEFASFAFTSGKIFSRDCFEGFANGLSTKWFAPRASSASPMAGSFSISWRGAGNWSHLNRIAPNWCLSGRTSLRNDPRFSVHSTEHFALCQSPLDLGAALRVISLHSINTATYRFLHSMIHRCNHDLDIVAHALSDISRKSERLISPLKRPDAI